MVFDPNRTLASSPLSLLWLWETRFYLLSKHHRIATTEGKMQVLRARTLGVLPNVFARVLPSRTTTQMEETDYS